MEKRITRFLRTFLCGIFFVGLAIISAPLLAGSTQQKIVEISGYFLNDPYQLEPLGEGKQGKFNQEPIYRFDKFDCETYVDTVLALSKSTNIFEFEQDILNIRYKSGRPNFFDRNHFPSADWIPNNVRKNYIHYLFIPNYVYSELNGEIDKKQFYNNMDISRIKIPKISPAEKLSKLNQLRSYSQVVQNVAVKLSYIPLRDVPAEMQYIPSGAIIMIVKPRQTVLISHMGFGIWKNNELYLRSASSMKNRVADVNLLHYLQYESQFNPVIGIAVFTT